MRLASAASAGGWQSSGAGYRLAGELSAIEEMKNKKTPATLQRNNALAAAAWQRSRAAWRHQLAHQRKKAWRNVSAYSAS
jgi:hypothetical protein